MASILNWRRGRSLNINPDRKLIVKQLRLFIQNHFWSIAIVLILVLNVLIFSRDRTVRKYYLYRDYAYFHRETEEIDFPVLAIDGALADTYGQPRTGGRIHEGIDIFCAWGTPVVAVIDGTIVFKGQDKLGGKVLYLLGRDNRVYYYAHLSRFADIRNGSRVRKKQLIGWSGNSGNAWSTPPHLHFEIMTVPWLLPLVLKNINPYAELTACERYAGLLDSLAQIAEEIPKMPVKVHSTAAKQIKQEMEKFIYENDCNFAPR